MWLVNLSCRGIYFGKLKGRGYILYDFCVISCVLHRIEYNAEVDQATPKRATLPSGLFLAEGNQDPADSRKLITFPLTTWKKIRQGQKRSYF